jgi:phosphatidylserine/phosphatidylglycerophosphate/cardiolipin synthase-like enzyme
MRFKGCSPNELERLAQALRDGRLAIPCSAVALSRLSLPATPELIADLDGLSTEGLSAKALASMAEAIRDERSAAVDAAPVIELVATGPDPGERVRDTAVVVNQLFAEAKQSVLMTGFALYNGRQIFQRLAERMDADLSLEVTLCLDISRPGTETTRDSDIVARFAKAFLERHWPGERLPVVYYDPRALSMDRAARSVLHAKALVVDRRTAFVTSANPTPAAYQRNIELGVLISGSSLPGQISDHIGGLIRSGALQQLSLRPQQA